jgi:ketosteroid isomerase-like protein
MSEENVEIVRRLFEATARRDGATVAAFYDKDIEYDVSRAALGSFTAEGVYHGFDGLQQVLREWDEAWDDIEYEPKEMVDAGERVASTVQIRGRGRESGIEFDGQATAVFTFRAGKVIRVAWFSSRDEALEAAGLSE